MPLDAQTKAWLAALHQGGAYSYWWILQDKQTRWWEVGSETPIPTGAYDVYVGVHPVGAIPTTNADGERKDSTALRSRNELVTHTNCVFADFDIKDERYKTKVALTAHLTTLEPEPSVIIDTGGGYHCYWFFDSTYAIENEAHRESAQKLARAWVMLMGGDEVKDLARILRVPGLHNQKYNPPRPVAFARCDLHKRYGRSELWALCEAFMPDDSLPSTERATGDVADVGSRWLGNAVQRVRSAPDGQKHHTLLKAAKALGGLVHHGALTEHEIESSLFAAIETRADDPAGARKTIKDGIAYGKSSPWPADKLTYSYSQAEQEVDSHSGSQNSHNPQIGPRPAEKWGAIVPFDSTNLPTFPTDIFPAWLRDFVDATAIATQTPPDLSAMLALSVLATCCQRWVMVQVRPGWQEPVNLYGVTALDPGNRKSAVFRAFNAPLLAYEQRIALEAKAKIAEIGSHKDILEQQLETAKRDAARAKNQNDQLNAMDEVDRLTQEVAALAIPNPPQLIVDDVTPEALSTLLHEQGGRMAALSAEGDIFAIMAGRYTSGGPNFGVFLKAHAGDTLRVNRRGRAEFVDYPTLTLGITTQPDVIRGLAEKAGFRGQGLLGRFLYAIPESLMGRRLVNPPVVPVAVREAYHAGINQLLDLRDGHSANCANTGDTDTQSLNMILDNIVILFTVSEECSPLLHSFMEWLEPHLGNDGAFGAFADWAAKLTGAVMRIAGLLAMSANVGTQYSHNSLNTIDIPTLTAALKLADYLIAHARAAFAEMDADPSVARARKALKWIADKTAMTFTKRDLFEALKGSIPKADDLDPILKVLTDHAYIRPVEEEQRSGPGRKPSQRYDVNPLFHSQNSQNSPKLPSFVIPEPAPEQVANGMHDEPIPDAISLIKRLRDRQVGDE